jgi:hypothetical protein
LLSTPGIKKPLNNINPHKATGPDNISGRVLKELQEKTAPILSLIFTKSFHTGKTPIDWFAFSIVSAVNSPPLLMVGMPELSVLIDLMYWNSLLGLA